MNGQSEKKYEERIQLFKATKLLQEFIILNNIPAKIAAKSCLNVFLNCCDFDNVKPSYKIQFFDDILHIQEIKDDKEF